MPNQSLARTSQRRAGDRDAQSGPAPYINIWWIRWETVVNLIPNGWGSSSSNNSSTGTNSTHLESGLPPALLPVASVPAPSLALPEDGETALQAVTTE